MAGEHQHPHPHERRSWGEPEPSLLRRIAARISALAGGRPAVSRQGAADLPLALRRSELGPVYLAADGRGDHPAAAGAASDATERAIAAGEWWQADAWAHRALWHFEQAEMTVDAVRVARRIGDLRTAAGDPASARRYYAEAIDEARDIGAEREQGLAALGLGRAHLELGEVTVARRLASAAVDLLDRAEAPAAELASARALLGSEVVVGEPLNDETKEET